MEAAGIARVALSAATYAIDKPYDYLIPLQFSAGAQPGVRVIVPFGAGNRRIEGVILTVSQTSSTDKRLKALIALLDEAPVLNREGIKLALWMRERFFCTVYDAVRAMLPAGLWFSLHDHYRIQEGVDKEGSYQAAGRSDHARRILDMLFPGAENWRRRPCRTHRQAQCRLCRRLCSAVFGREAFAA